MKIKGYPIDVGYMGYLPSKGEYELFDSESDYEEYIQDNEEEFK